MVLIARALVKSPTLLMLDEPCQGLDRENRERVLDLIEFIGARSLSHILYVTHYSEEIPPCISHVLRLGGAPGGEILAAEPHQPGYFQPLRDSFQVFKIPKNDSSC